MADIDFDDYDLGYDPVPARSFRLERMTHLAGAALSVALLAGGVWWGWQLAVLDVSGVPVMRALGGPMRVAPTDPGGDVATNMGLSVNAVAAVGTATVLPDKLTLAPEISGLAAEDAPGLALPVVGDTLREAGTVAEPVALLAPEPPAQALATEIPGADQNAVAAALAEALAAPEPAAPGVPGFAPRPRPGSATAATLAAAPSATEILPAAVAAEPAAAVSAPVSGAEVDMASVTPGTWLVQLGAYETPEAARSDWTRIAGRYPELMADKQFFIQSSVSGGRTFYRLRALEFADDAESRRFCLVLLADNASCVPVIHRIE